LVRVLGAAVLVLGAAPRGVISVEASPISGVATPHL